MTSGSLHPDRIVPECNPMTREIGSWLGSCHSLFTGKWRRNFIAPSHKFGREPDANATRDGARSRRGHWAVAMTHARLPRAAARPHLFICLRDASILASRLRAGPK